MFFAWVASMIFSACAEDNSVENLTIDDETWYEANDEETLSAGDSQSLYHHIARDSAIAKHLHGRFLGTAQCFGGDARPYRFWDIF